MQAAPPPVVASHPTSHMFACGTCGLRFEQRPELMTHYKGDLHRANLQRKVQQLEPLSYEQFRQRQEAEAAAPLAKQDQRTRRQEQRLEQQLDRSSRRSGQAGGGGAGPEKDLQRTDCLFSRQRFDSVETAVDHMRREYGFFLPDQECLTDLYGLMDMLRLALVRDHCCWYCGKVGRSYEATVQHMVDKSHCKLPYDGSHPDLAAYYSFGAEEHADSHEDAWQPVGSTPADESAQICGVVAAPHTAEAEAAAARVARTQKMAPPVAAATDEGWVEVDATDDAEADQDAESEAQMLAGGTELRLPSGQVVGHRAARRQFRQAPRRAAPRAGEEEASGSDGEGEAAETADDAEVGAELQEHRQGSRAVAQHRGREGPAPVDREARRAQVQGDAKRERATMRSAENRSAGAATGGRRATVWEKRL